jgi:O-antigen ligase
MHKDLNSMLDKLVIWALVLVSLLISPNVTADAVNPAKILALTSAASMGIAILLSNRSALSLGIYKIPILLISGFILWLGIVFVFSSGEKTQQLYGVSGRNTGLITYVSLAFVFIISMVISRKEFYPKFLVSVLVVGSTSLVYGFIQSIGLDPLPWQEIYSPVLGFLGNPNFQSSLLGILGVLVFTQLLSSVVTVKVKIGYLFYLLVTLYVIHGTDSQQGFLVLLIGSAISFGIYLVKINMLLGVGYIAIGTLGFFAVIMGILNKGILASVLYKDSVVYRGDYWRAGWNMTLENPIIGVGLDSYGDWYRRSRTLEATLRRGPEVTSNAAHNVYLDISSYGGFPLLFLYAGLMGLVLLSALRVMRREKSFNPSFVGLMAAWIAFQAQSIISINQIGLAIWGWVISGLIIGYEVNTRDNPTIDQKSKKVVLRSSGSASQSTTLFMLVGLLVGTLIGAPTFLSSLQHNMALKKSDVNSVVQAAYIWPYDPIRMIQVATTLNDNNLENRGLEVILDATRKFPDNYAVWSTLNSMKRANVVEKAEALAQMKRLDPLNPNLK